jgi:hypothetical protein
MARKIENTERASGTSFHDTVLLTSVNKIIEALGEPTFEDNAGSDKVNFEWICETESGEVFTIYDWKEYRPISKTEIIEWHIGGKSGRITELALKEMLSLVFRQKTRRLFLGSGGGIGRRRS